MRKFAVLSESNGKKLFSIEIVSDDRLKEYGGVNGYLSEMYEECLIDFAEIGDNNTPAEISVYKEGITNQPLQEDIEKDIKLIYW